MTDKQIRITPKMEVLILAELAKRVRERQNITRAIIGVAFDNGDKQTFRSPLDDRKLGSIWRQDPDPEWRVTDEKALHTWLAGQPDYLETTVEVREGCEAEALAILAEHAPHLLEDVTGIRADAVERLLEASREQGEPAAPGIERIKPPGHLTVRPDKAAGEAIEAMVKAGVISWDGRPALEAEADPVVDVPVISLPFRRDTPRGGGDAA